MHFFLQSTLQLFSKHEINLLSKKFTKFWFFSLAGYPKISLIITWNSNALCYFFASVCLVVSVFLKKKLVATHLQLHALICLVVFQGCYVPQVKHFFQEFFLYVSTLITKKIIQTERFLWKRKWKNNLKYNINIF